VSVPPLLFAAHGDRARCWADVIRRSHALELRAAIDLAAGGRQGLDEALTAWPDAAVAVWAAGPIEATRLAERLATHVRPSVLHPPPAHAMADARGVQVVHGWISLSGIPAIERLFASSSVLSVRLRVHGLPEGPAVALEPALYHAATVVRRFGRAVHVERAVLEDEQKLSLTLDVDRIKWRVDVSARKGPELSLAVQTDAGVYTWTADAVSETLERPGAEPRALPQVPWAERCLRQLATPVRGASLADAHAARELIDAVEQALERRLPPAPPRIEPVVAASASLRPPPPEVSGMFRAPAPQEITMRRRSPLERVGLTGDVPAAAPLAPRAPPYAELPFEALAYRLELRPAVFLTTDLESEERVRKSLPGTIERRERFVSIAAGDRWDDDRGKGEPRVELFAARDASTARRLAELQSGDPSESAQVIGGLLGYPACCVQAFAAQADRSDNSYNRYAIAARTSWGPGPWPQLLDDTSLKLLPHFPCTYRCERSRAQADALVGALAEDDPELCRAVLEHLGGPVLYFDHDHQLRFDGAVMDGGITYRSLSIPWSASDAFSTLAGAIARGNRVVFDESVLCVYAGDTKLFTLDRTDPGLGVLLPFGR
jgi:hypothetical protein